MYDMYPYPDAITQRANKEELAKWEQQGAEPADPTDYTRAGLVESAEKVAAMDSIRFQVAANAMVRQSVQVSQS